MAGVLCARSREALQSVAKQTRSFASASSLASQLLDSVSLKQGDVIIQNGAESATGKEIIKEAKRRGLRTLNVVKDAPGLADTVESLKDLGADIVVPVSYTNTWYIKRLLSDLPTPALALNSSAGAEATSVAKLVGSGGKLVTYGEKLPTNVVYPGMERRPVKWSDWLKARKLQSQSL